MTLQQFVGQQLVKRACLGSNEKTPSYEALETLNILRYIGHFVSNPTLGVETVGKDLFFQPVISL